MMMWCSESQPPPTIQLGCPPKLRCVVYPVAFHAIAPHNFKPRAVLEVRPIFVPHSALLPSAVFLPPWTTFITLRPSAHGSGLG